MMIRESDSTPRTNIAYLGVGDFHKGCPVDSMMKALEELALTKGIDNDF